MKKKPKWELQVKGDLPRSYEISAIRSNNNHGHISYGWGGLDKIILFSSALGGNVIWEMMASKSNHRKALKLAQIIVDALNEKDK